MTVTALVSAYLAEKYINRRIENLLRQKPLPEIVVVCQEGSIEHKASIEYPVIVITTPDIPTLGKAWNLAIKKASGDLVTVANTDDIVYPGGYAYMEKIFRDERVGLVFPRIDVDDLRTVTSWNRYREDEGLVEDAYALMKARNIIGPMPMWRRSLHEVHGYMNEDFLGITDYDWTLRLAKAGVGFYYVNEPQGCYTRRADSLEHRLGDTLRAERLKVRPRK